ncbi:MAG: DUF86 domain-containing protein [Bacteroidota bacterium]|nr:DUF86 domain-containing protein [Bacteroidota bacterium]
MKKDDFVSNKLVQDAVIRNFEIIGEASKNISVDFRTLYPHIPWKQMAGMRDKLIHHYITVDLDAVWTTITDELPDLKIELEKFRDYPAAHPD